MISDIRGYRLTAMKQCALMAQEPKPLPKTVLFFNMNILHLQEDVWTPNRRSEGLPDIHG